MMYPIRSATAKCGRSKNVPISPTIFVVGVVSKTKISEKNPIAKSRNASVDINTINGPQKNSRCHH